MMEARKNTLNRRAFMKASALAGGGMMLSFSWLAGCMQNNKELANLPEEWFELNSYIKISRNGLVTLFSPNPEFGSNVKTSMPMILAEELDVDWQKVIVEQADFFPKRYNRQFTGGSQGIRLGWRPLRTAGATARHMLMQAAATKWNVPLSEITTSAGMVYHKSSGKQASYGELASAAATIPVPEQVELKNNNEFSIIGTSRKNVDGKKIVTGHPLFGIDYKAEGMLVATIVHPPFGMRIKSVDDTSARSLPGIKDIFVIKTYSPDYEQNAFDTISFTEVVARLQKSLKEPTMGLTWRIILWNRPMLLRMSGPIQPRFTLPYKRLSLSSEHYRLFLTCPQKKFKYDWPAWAADLASAPMAIIFWKPL